MRKAFSIVLACGLLSTPAVAGELEYRQLYLNTVTMSDDEIVDLYWRENASCSDDWSGDLAANKHCLRRSDLTRLLNRRGMCQAVSGTVGEWVPCIVGNGYLPSDRSDPADDYLFGEDAS